MKKIISTLIKIRDRLTLKKITLDEDEYILWLTWVNGDMLHPGNIYAIKHCIKNLPTNDPILEIGSFAGLSTNVISYFLKKYNKKNIIFCCDKWLFERKDSDKNTNVGLSHISHNDYSSFVEETFKRNINFFSSNQKIHPIKLFSDELFEKWQNKEIFLDIFKQSVVLGGNLSFAYIDGNHTYEYAKRDFINVHQNLVPRGFILFDDTTDDNPFGLTKLIKEIKKRSDYALVFKNPNYLFQKIKTD
jgi:hypothetical protein